mmetsp:Transcript_26766/g.29841  ORF Transcript_26766/g.29841 Transcript_26766/m.29841 type:complete len:145 (-) Transcript_26766:388-822(-)
MKSGSKEPSGDEKGDTEDVINRNKSKSQPRTRRRSGDNGKRADRRKKHSSNPQVPIKDKKEKQQRPSSGNRPSRDRRRRNTVSYGENGTDENGSRGIKQVQEAVRMADKIEALKKQNKALKEQVWLEKEKRKVQKEDIIRLQRT